MSEIPQELIEGLAGRYELRGVVGRGGMATVYGATDLKHNRDVAIKVLKPELSATLGAERFLREIEIAAQLQHPHILMLIDSGQTGDTLYYVMPLVEGGSLRSKIDDGPLDLDQAISITEKVADALRYAHRQGVVHRDIKPENILFSSDHPVVGDFGIAKAISTAGAVALTRTGFPLGTVGYMSPEQAAGSTDLGPASDVYSLACVTYEMLVGAVPGIWLSDTESEEGYLADIPDQHRNLLDALPGHVEPALARALARKAAHRFDDPIDFVAALTDKSGAKSNLSHKRVAEPSRPTAQSQIASRAHSDTVGAMEAIAADVGISPQRLQDAIMQIDSTGESSDIPFGLFSLPSHLDVEATVVGEIPQSEFASLLDVIQLDLRTVGTVDEIAGRLSWNNSTWEGEGIHITVRPKRGETKLMITEPAGPYKIVATAAPIAAGGLLTFLLVGLGSVEGVIGSGWALALAVAVIGGGSISAGLLGGRFVLRRFLQSRRKKLTGLMARLTGVARKAIAGSSEFAASTGEKDVRKSFSEGRVNEIIRHAAESQFANPTTDGNLTIGAIEEIAADVGLSPQRVHEAIMQLDAAPGVPALTGGLFSSPSPIDLETTVDGEVPQAELGALLDTIRMDLKDSGQVNEARGNSLSWTSSPLFDMPNGVGITHITVNPKRGKTKLVIAERTGAYSAGVTVVSLLGGGALVFVCLPDAALWAAVGLSSAIVAGRVYLRRTLKARRRQLEGLLGKLAKVSRELVGEHTTG